MSLAQISANPYDFFTIWFQEAAQAEPNDPNAMALATVGADGRPSVRMVLLKDWGREGFVFYTNLESRKGRDLRANPAAALCFHWKSLQRQVRIEGMVEPVTPAAADEYFMSRARGSRIGAWASKQSQILSDRALLDQRIAEFEEKFADGDIPRPVFWSGFAVRPERFEFWQNQPSRLHDRLAFIKEGEDWRAETLYP